MNKLIEITTGELSFDDMYTLELAAEIVGKSVEQFVIDAALEQAEELIARDICDNLEITDVDLESDV